MQWTKSPKELVDAFDEALARFPTAERRMMFGSPAAFVNGNMFASVHQHQMVFRLPQPQREELLRVEGAEIFEPMPGRPMREYVAAPPAIASDPSQIDAWLARALDYASAMPPKEKKPRASTRKAQRG
jgi:TfoX/Sxy family transcriptional regulator of competence genes